MKYDNVDRCVGGIAKFDDKPKKGATEGYGHAALVRHWTRGVVYDVEGC